MKGLLVPLFLLLALSTVFSQKITNYRQYINIGDSTSIALDIDSTLVKVEYWDGDVVQVYTQVAYEEQDLDLITDIMRKDGFDLEALKEAGGYRLSTMPFGQYWRSQLSMGVLYTIYLPKAVEEVVWLVDIPMP